MLTYTFFVLLAVQKVVVCAIVVAVVVVCTCWATLDFATATGKIKKVLGKDVEGKTILRSEG